MEKSTSLESSQLELVLEKFSPFLVEVRRRVFFTIFVFVAAAFGGFVFYERIIKFFIETLSLGQTNIVFTSPFQFINLAFSCGFATGVVVVMPILIVQILFFLKPAMREKEYKIIVKVLPFSALLFVVGFIFGALIMKWQIDIFLARSVSMGIGNVLDISHLLSMILMTSVLMAIGFQFPIFLLILMHLRVITRKQLASKRKWVYLAAFVFTLFLPPDSILADIILSMPFIISFEITLILNRVLERRRA